MKEIQGSTAQSCAHLPNDFATLALDTAPTDASPSDTALSASALSASALDTATSIDSQTTSLSQREEAALGQYLNQLCTALAEATRFQPEAGERDSLERRGLAPEETENDFDASDPEFALLAVSDAATQAININEPDVEDRVAASSNDAPTAPQRPKPDAGGNDFWDAVAAQHATQGALQPGNERSVFDAVAQVAADRSLAPVAPEQVPALTTRAQTPSTQETQQQSIDIIAAFESLLGLDEPEPSPLLARDPLRQNAERAVFAALTFAEGTTLSAAGRRG